MMRKWLMHFKPEGGPSNISFMKCVGYVQFHIKSPWGFGRGCKRMQKGANEITQTTLACF
jgi:hypothetical protein